MKQLLAALIAVLFIVLPLHADEPTQTVSVRVVDHKGEPIRGLVLKAAVGTTREAGVTDASGIASFVVPDGTDSRTISIVPSEDLPPNLRFTARDAKHPSEADQDHPKVNRGLLRSYAFDPWYEFDLDEFVDGPVTIRAPESIQCKIRVRVIGITGMAPLSYALQPRGGRSFSWEGPGPFDWLESGQYAVTSLPIRRGEAVEIAVKVDTWFFMAEFDAEQTTADASLAEFSMPDPDTRFGTVQLPSNVETDSANFCFVRSDGEHANVVYLSRRRVETTDGREQIRSIGHHLPAGEYVVLPSRRTDSTWSASHLWGGWLGRDLWSPGAIFDTMLRLRRGEKLPHLKRITITEGGTVEISPDDYTLPPAKAQPADEPQPDDPR